MDAADITVTRPEPFRREQRSEGWCIVDARGGLVAVCVGEDAWRNATALAGCLDLGAGRERTPGEIAAEEAAEDSDAEAREAHHDLDEARGERDEARNDLEREIADHNATRSERDRLQAELDERDGAFRTPAATPAAPPTGTQTGFDLSKLVEKRS